MGLGNDIKLMVDAGVIWSGPYRVSRAFESAKAIAQFDVVWLEEPFRTYDV